MRSLYILMVWLPFKSSLNYEVENYTMKTSGKHDVKLSHQNTQVLPTYAFFCFHSNSKLGPNKASFDTCLNTNVNLASLGSNRSDLSEMSLWFPLFLLPSLLLTACKINNGKLGTNHVRGGCPYTCKRDHFNVCITVFPLQISKTLRDEMLWPLW